MRTFSSNNDNGVWIGLVKIFIITSSFELCGVFISAGFWHWLWLWLWFTFDYVFSMHISMVCDIGRWSGMGSSSLCDAWSLSFNVFENWFDGLDNKFLRSGAGVWWHWCFDISSNESVFSHSLQVTGISRIVDIICKLGQHTFWYAVLFR